MLAEAAIAYGVYDLMASLLEGKSIELSQSLKDGLLIVGGALAIVCVILTLKELAGAAAMAAFAALMAAVAYVITEAVTAHFLYEEAVAAHSREEMQRLAHESAKNAQGAVVDGVLVLPALKSLPTLLKQMTKPTMGAPGEEGVVGRGEEKKPEAVASEKKGGNATPIPQIDADYLLQKGIVVDVAEGRTLLSSTARKGNYGEMRTDVEMVEKGWTPEHRRVTDIDAPTERGIDHVFSKEGPPRLVIVADSKFGTSRLSTLADGTKQMSSRWIKSRLTEAVGDDLADEILATGYQSVVANVNAAGEISYRLLDRAGRVLGSFLP
jgi:hypothetical protein